VVEEVDAARALEALVVPGRVDADRYQRPPRPVRVGLQAFAPLGHAEGLADIVAGHQREDPLGALKGRVQVDDEAAAGA
jgi:hypothetical protein